ncbi:hypothetical protein [Cohnella cholangitidis]|nr:hypothetical protein [Cohnella cholangitidis]
MMEAKHAETLREVRRLEQIAAAIESRSIVQIACLLFSSTSPYTQIE